MKKILLTGGGTGGHVFPALSLIPKLKKNYEIFYMGGSGMEKNILSDFPQIPYYEIPASKLERKFSLKNLLLPFRLLNSVRVAKKHLKKIKPHIVFSKGGFVAVPVVIAAHKLKIPVVSHESDLTFGLANKIILRFSKKMCTNFLETAMKTKKGVHTGAPIREQIFKGKKIFMFKNSKPCLLVLGGSLGAIKINKTISENIDELLKKFNIIHITGKNKTDIDREGYYQTEFTNKIEDFYATANYVISRAGAGVIFELLALQKPMLLIPLSKECSRGDQIDNAKKFKEIGYCEVLFEEEIDKLSSRLNTLISNKNKHIENMKKHGNLKGADGIIKVLSEVLS